MEFTLSLMLLTVVTFVQAQSSEKELITAAITNYLEGRNNGDLERLRSAFHPWAVLKSVSAIQDLATLSLEDYIARHTPGRKQTPQTEIAFIDYVGNVATAKVIIRNPTFAYHDYLVLLKVKGTWAISEKVFFKEDF